MGRKSSAVVAGLLLLAAVAAACGGGEEASRTAFETAPNETASTDAGASAPEPAPAFETASTGSGALAPAPAPAVVVASGDGSDLAAEAVPASSGRQGDEKLAPELLKVSSWINSDGFTLESQRGNVVLIDFWTYTCVNCIRTLPYLRSWHEKYADQGLVSSGSTRRSSSSRSCGTTSLPQWRSTISGIRWRRTTSSGPGGPSRTGSGRRST